MFLSPIPFALNNLSIIYIINNLNQQNTIEKRINYFLKISNNHFNYKQEQIDYIIKLWNLYRKLCYLIHGYLGRKRSKRFQIRNTTDFFLNDLDINSNEVIKHIDYYNKSIYLFSFNDISKTWLSSINFHNFEIASPIDLKNPYNNTKLSFLEFYNIYRQFEEISYLKHRSIPLLIQLHKYNLLNYKKLSIYHSYFLTYNASFNYVRSLSDDIFRVYFLSFYNTLLENQKPCKKCFKLEDLKDYRDVFNRVIALFLLEENNIAYEDLIRKWRKILIKCRLFGQNHDLEFHPNLKPKKKGKLIGKSNKTKGPKFIITNTDPILETS